MMMAEIVEWFAFYGGLIAFVLFCLLWDNDVER